MLLSLSSLAFLLGRATLTARGTPCIMWYQPRSNTLLFWPDLRTLTPGKFSALPVSCASSSCRCCATLLVSIFFFLHAALFRPCNKRGDGDDIAAIEQSRVPRWNRCGLSKMFTSKFNHQIEFLNSTLKRAKKYNIRVKSMFCVTVSFYSEGIR